MWSLRAHRSCFWVSSCVSRILEPTEFAPEVRTFWMIPCDGPFFLALENLTVWFDANFPLTRIIDFLCLSTSLSAREGARNHTTVLCTFFHRFFYTVSPFNPEGLTPRGLPYLWGFLPSVWVGAFEVEEDDCALWPEWDPWMKRQESPFEHSFFAFRWKHSPTFPSALTVFPFWLLTNTPASTLSLKFRVLIVWLICCLTIVLNFWSLRATRSRLNSWLHIANTVWSCSEPCNMFLYTPSRTFSGDISLVPKLEPFCPKKPTEFLLLPLQSDQSLWKWSEQLITTSSVATVIQSSADVEHELLSLNSDSWTDAQLPNPCTLTVIQGFAEHVSLPTDDPIEDFSEVDMATGSMASAGRSHQKHPRTGSEEDNMDFAALLDRAADRFSTAWRNELMRKLTRNSAPWWIVVGAGEDQ